ncbi:MAG: hypothetical protein ACUVRD_00305 [Bacteroidia bacterium]
MEFYLEYVGREYQHGYKSYAKSFLAYFGVVLTGYQEKEHF